MNLIRRYKKLTYAFTIVELLVVVVIIGILASISLIAYAGVSNKAIISSLQSDLSGASTKLKAFQVENNGSYPLTNNCGVAESSTNICLKSSSGNMLTYVPINSVSPRAFRLTAVNGSRTYIVTDSTSPYQPITCPTNFIVVPGNSTYGTNDFCVMKYEAKNVGGVATSQTTGTVWVSITQEDAVTAASAACVGCHLLTPGEYATIAQNVLNNPINWSSGTVGSGYIYSGHNDNDPPNAIDADSNDNNGYLNTNNSAGAGPNQKRTLTLNNGEVIWDLAGNVWEWTTGQATGGQPGVKGSGTGWYEWTGMNTLGSITPNPSPVATGISGASAWNSSNGMGLVFSNADDVALRKYFRGGAWNIGSGSIGTGVLALNLMHGLDIYNNVGFRVAK